MKPYYQEDGVTIYHGDCLEIATRIDAAIVSDPPYGMRNKCASPRFTMGPNGHGQASLRSYSPIHGDDQEFDPSPWLQRDEVILFGSNHFGARLLVGTTLVWIKRFDGGFGAFLSDAEDCVEEGRPWRLLLP